jgi:hypothetical protein
MVISFSAIVFAVWWRFQKVSKVSVAFLTAPFMASPFYIQQNDNKGFYHNQGEFYDCVKEE